MCGIAGFNWHDPSRIKKMVQLLTHRGPDGEGVYLDEWVSLGHRRLTIIDLSPAGQQPMPNEDGSLWLVYNGEIYNYVELREELEKKGHRFRSNTDSEVILHAYEAWGENCVSQFNGMFAFCIYDKRRKRLFLARDRYGVKPLHYFFLNGKFTFASEIKAILSDPNIPRKPNDCLIYDYLVYNCYNHTPETFFQGIQTIPPGHTLIFDLNTKKITQHCWYDIPLDASQDRMDEEEVAVQFKDLLMDAIRLRLRSDVEVGACLSGGLDSSSIVCSLKQLHPENSLRFNTFSVTFPRTEIDESLYIEKVVSSANVISHVIHPTSSDLLHDINHLVYYQEEPFGGTSIFAQWEVMKLSKQNGVKVLLDGQGGDELLAGYLFFYGYYFLQLLLSFRWKKLWEEVVHYHRIHPNVPDGLLTPFLLLTPAFFKPYLMRRYFPNTLNSSFFNQYHGTTNIPPQMYAPMSLNQALYYRMKYGLPQLLREEDRNSMAFSVESRLPFLDYRVVNFLFSLPEHFKVRRGMTKYILRKAMKGILPEEIRLRAGKLGFPTPMDSWMREPEVVRFMKRIFSSDAFRSRKYHRYSAVEKLLQSHLDGKINGGQTLWKLLNLELWFKIFIDGDYSKTAF